MLGNIASELLLCEPSKDALSRHLLASITSGLTSCDRGQIVGCLEVLNKLCQKDENEDLLLRHIEQPVQIKFLRYFFLAKVYFIIPVLPNLGSAKIFSRMYKYLFMNIYKIFRADL